MAVAGLKNDLYRERCITADLLLVSVKTHPQHAG
jgi:hypothetical protein